MTTQLGLDPFINNPMKYFRASIVNKVSELQQLVDSPESQELMISLELQQWVDSPELQQLDDSSELQQLDGSLELRGLHCKSILMLHELTKMAKRHFRNIDYDEICLRSLQAQLNSYEIEKKKCDDRKEKYLNKIHRGYKKFDTTYSDLKSKISWLGFTIFVVSYISKKLMTAREDDKVDAIKNDYRLRVGPKYIELLSTYREADESD